MKGMTIISDKTVTYVKEEYSIQLAVFPLTFNEQSLKVLMTAFQINNYLKKIA